MTTIEVIGHVNEKGQLEFEPPALPPGGVRIIIETIDAEAEAADEALWDEQFAKSQDLLSKLAQEAIEQDDAGLTKDFDPHYNLNPVSSVFSENFATIPAGL
jgi:hypothetical protein